MHVIAIIDDSLEDRETYKRFLKQDSDNQYTFIEADSAEEGLDLCKKIAPDCIILDYLLPDLNATEVITQLREYTHIPPVIVTTGHGSEAIAVELMHEGIQDYLIKSQITAEALQRSVKNTIERINLQKTVFSTEQELVTVLNTVIDGVIVIDDTGTIQSSNPAVSNIFGYTKAELIGKNVKMLMPESYAQDHDLYISSYLETGDGKIIGKGREVEGLRKDGSIFSLELGINEMRIGGKRKFVGTLRDISERKEREAQIQYEKERADRANKAKSMFLATMSHEIRTPMNGIIGVAELLSYCKLDEKSERYVDTIQSSGELLLVLINDILDFSKIEAGELELETVPIVVNALLNEVVHMLSNRANNNDVEIALRCPIDAPISIYSDPTRLRQILINLLGNAIKFSKGGHVLVDVKKVKQNNDSITLRFEINDTGIGIAKDKLSSIFEQFSQADSSTTREFGGTGLGLAICKKLVELMGGKIGVTSQVGKGSIFWFEVAFKMHVEHKVTSIDKSRKLKNKRILIIDDYEVNLEVFSGYLKRIGVNSDITNSPEEALQKIEHAYKNNQPYDVILVDYRMPKMNGEMLGYTIQENPEKFGIPKMIMLTAMGKKDDFSMIKKAGFSDYLIKPIYPTILIDTILRTLDIQNDEGEQPNNNDQDHESDTNYHHFPQFDASILIVEDFRPNLDVATAILEKFGCKTHVAVDGIEAISELTKNHSAYDIVFMDCQMPNMDGFDTTKEIRNYQWGKNLIIVAMTANALQGDRDKCIKAGMNDYITKPIKIDSIQATLEKFLMNKKISQAS